MKRKGKDAIHYLPESLEVGSTVTGVIDWERRWDHMQQHSGQHLITALADSMFGFKTTSWWLGETVSHIELGGASSINHSILNSSRPIIFHNV